MRFVKLLAIAGFSVACVTALEETEPPPPPPAKDVVQPKKQEPMYGPRRVRMLCEFGCPATMPFLNIMRVFPPDVTDTKDAEPDAVDITDTKADMDAGVTSPDSCGDAYEFSTCCGNDVCEGSESVFFCPGDCS